MTGTIYVGDSGTIFRVTLKKNGAAIDISDATLKQIRIRRPNNTIVYKEATFTTDGSDGNLEYKFGDGDIDVAGSWDLQAHVELPGGRWSSQIYTLTIKDAIIMKGITGNMAKAIADISRNFVGSVS